MIKTMKSLLRCTTACVVIALAAFNIDETWTPLETVVDGNLAYQRGTFTVVASPTDRGG